MLYMNPLDLCCVEISRLVGANEQFEVLNTTTRQSLPTRHVPRRTSLPIPSDRVATNHVSFKTANGNYHPSILPVSNGQTGTSRHCLSADPFAHCSLMCFGGRTQNPVNTLFEKTRNNIPNKPERCYTLKVPAKYTNHDGR